MIQDIEAVSEAIKSARVAEQTVAARQEHWRTTTRQFVLDYLKDLNSQCELRGSVDAEGSVENLELIAISFSPQVTDFVRRNPDGAGGHRHVRRGGWVGVRQVLSGRVVIQRQLPYLDGLEEEPRIEESSEMEPMALGREQIFNALVNFFNAVAQKNR